MQSISLWLSGAIAACVTQVPVPTGAALKHFFSSPILLPFVLCITNRLSEGNNFVRADLDLLAAENGFKPH